MPDDAALAVELEAAPEPGEDASNAWYGEASGRHRGEGWRERVVMSGDAAVRAAAGAVGREVGVVVRETLDGLDAESLARPGPAGLTASSIQFTFGVKLTAGIGKAIEAVLTAGGEASVQVVVTLTPTPSTPPPPPPPPR